MRPGGLTALSVLNFVFGGLGLLMSLIAIAVSIPAYEEMMSEGGDQAMQMFGQAPPPIAALYVVAVLGLVTGGLLVASGVGYLQQSKALGRTVGTAYAAIAVIATILEIAWVGQDFGMLTLFSWVYPLLTLFFLYAVFREDFVR